VLETLQHLNRLTSYGIGYRSFTEQHFDSCGIFKDAVIAIIATVAKQERIRISQRVKAGLETARAKGKRLGRPRVAVDATRIGRLRSQGRSIREIARELGCSRSVVHKTLAESRGICAESTVD
jgi:DNA invertase Pin-like site-specific DNA recombinase